MKTQRLTVTSGWSLSNVKGLHPAYRVEQVSNSIYPEPGCLLSRTQLDEYCNDPAWDITIKPYPRHNRS